MPLFGSNLRRLLHLRRTFRTLDRIAAALEQQNRLLARVVDHFVPELHTSTPDDLRTTGPSFSRDVEQAQILDFVGKFLAVSGREPTEDEVLEFLREQERPH